MEKILDGKVLMLVMAIVAIALFGFHRADAQTSNVTFPVAELGGCADAAACHAYCNDPANMQACTSFAASHGLESQVDVSRAKQFAAVLANGGGPGGCNSPDSCDAYCSTISHLDTCIVFAKKNNFTDENLSDGEKIASYIQAGGKMPGGCDSKDSCTAYCGGQSHRQECMAFAQAAGLPMGGPPGSNGAPSPEETQKFSAILQSGKTPGGCTTLQACLIYCNDPSHGSECGIFGEAMGVQGNMQVQKAGGPGGCTSDASCKAYCADPSHTAECQQFGHQGGQQGQGQGPMQAGPGGCTTDATCQSYCADPAHAAECQQFAHQSNYVQGSSSAYGSQTGGCGENQYWNGSECASSGSMGPNNTPPPCPAGQICNTNMDQGQPPTPPPPSSSSPQSYIPVLGQQANLFGVFGAFVQNLGRIMLGH